MLKHPGTVFTSALTIGAVAATLTFTGIAKADAFTYDVSLASPDTNAATADTGAGSNPSWYNGGGNPQGGWTVATDDDNGSRIELGLRAKYRQVNSVIDTSNNIYYVVPGLQTQPAPSNKAAWNYEFSIDLRPNGVGTLTLADIIASLTITDVTTGATATVNPLTYWSDDNGFGTGPGGAGGVTRGGTHVPETAGDWGDQNSENPVFADFPLAALAGEPFDPYAGNTYRFDLTVSNLTGTVLASDRMFVIVTTEPASVILFGTVLLGIFVLVLRRRKSIA